ncbi:dTDP-4-dehydrorhamnose reductase [Alkalispirochaeta americana]|uniref:dTDP-4-dehydrorhamnose reductase n=1 Tax=Alkalispirochaeta americana TaxID=159291 RepID=A0A1N6Q5A8_9SPIO|nr:NAD(P)-dependent oxidoreductase [Alkalispirochaeta americana]SIQ11727.1 dTDP-4-dehydrorhamnose reductase [Alkalispirochaeta americana]
MAKILITGNRGFLGTRFQRYHGRDHQIEGVGRADLDILDSDAVKRKIAACGPEIIIHGAAVTATAFCEENPDEARQINVTGALNVAAAARDAGARMVFLSTEQVFNGNDEPGPYSEDHQAVPNTVYGKTKLEAEEQLRETCDNLLILRLTWLFGLPEFREPVNSNVVWDAIRIAVSGKRTKVAVHEYRGVTWVYDLLDRFPALLEMPSGTYHVGSENDLNRYDLFRHVFRELGISHRVEELLVPDHKLYRERPRDIRLDTEKITARGIRFPVSTEAISQCLGAFMTTGMGSSR